MYIVCKLYISQKRFRFIPVRRHCVWFVSNEWFEEKIMIVHHVRK